MSHSTNRDVDSVSPRTHTASVSTVGSRPSNLITIIRDTPDWLQRFRSLHENDVLVLLTPVVTPISQDPTDTSDPFEPLGKALASRHAKVRQIPYTQRNGITSTHLGFIKRGSVIVLCLIIRPDHPLQLEFADVVLAVSDNKPCIIIIFTPQTTQLEAPLPTVIQTLGYSPLALEATAALIFGEGFRRGGLAHPLPVPNISEISRPRLWPVAEWDESKDISSVWNLWTLGISGISGSFSLDIQTLGSLLHRPGYAKHYAVRDPRNEELVGFCATYLSYVDQEGEKLIASLAVLLVKSTHQRQGIGLSLHSHAIDQLRRTRGVIRLQLGTTFPRILYGPPLGMDMNQEWFRRRGWQMDRDRPGQGRAVYDLVWRIPENASLTITATQIPELHFRACTRQDMTKVLVMVEEVSLREAQMGWFDQYSSLMNDPNIKDVMLGFVGETLVAAALTYTPDCGSAIALNLPWAGRIGHDVGGITCICISGTLPQFPCVHQPCH